MDPNQNRDRRQLKPDNRSTAIYVDARNFFKGYISSSGVSWVDIRRLLIETYPEFQELRIIKYFTSPGRGRLEAPLDAYHNALKAAQGVPPFSLYLGKVGNLDKDLCQKELDEGIEACPRAVAFRDKPSYKEKQVDVSMAIEVLCDVIREKDPIRKVVLVTNDTDFVPLIKKVKALSKSTDVVVLAPITHSEHSWAWELDMYADRYVPIRRKDVLQYLLPPSIRNSRGETIECPQRFIMEIRKHIRNWGFDELGR